MTFATVSQEISASRAVGFNCATLSGWRALRDILNIYRIGSLSSRATFTVNSMPKARPFASFLTSHLRFRSYVSIFQFPSAVFLTLSLT